MRLFLITCLLLLPLSVSAQDPQPPRPLETHQFDFWLGEWDLTWEGGKGTNTITAILDSAVIQEQFDSRPSENFQGKSVSVFNKHTKKWHQTWVDNQGGYLDFIGEFTDGKMILSRTAKRDGKEFLQRMIFYNIQPNSLDWNWERSDDNGKTWKPLWQIHYTRKK